MLEIEFAHLENHVLSILRASNVADSTLLITGETGTGKSHLAKAVHDAGPRHSNKWYKINLAVLSETLIESELFGHERGSFTGAEGRRIGRLEFCNGGTVFLDEIGELPLRIQSKLLDFIQYKKISPVGSNREIELDVRIIAATNKNLELAVERGEFRRDLFHRLNVFHVDLPSVTTRPDLVVRFAMKLLERRCTRFSRMSLGLHPELERLLRTYPWPGNIRELENAMEYAFAMTDTAVVRLRHLPLYLQQFAEQNEIFEISATANESEGACSVEDSIIPGADIATFQELRLPLSLDFHETKDRFEKAYLTALLRQHHGQINLTSRSIGLNKVSLTEKIRKYEIDWKSFRTDFSASISPTLP